MRGVNVQEHNCDTDAKLSAGMSVPFGWADGYLRRPWGRRRANDTRVQRPADEKLVPLLQAQAGRGARRYPVP
jgi:hypothetical protein